MYESHSSRCHIFWTAMVIREDNYMLEDLLKNRLCKYFTDPVVLHSLFDGIIEQIN
jgi:hypothetical protein